MLYYDTGKSNNCKECIVCRYRVFSHAFKFQNSVCNCYHDLTKLCLNLSDIAIITVKGVDFCCNVHDISKSDAIHLSKISVLDKRMSKKSIIKIKSTAIILTILSK